MKFSFSTLGCPGWDFSEMLSAARDLGYDGIEIRGIGNELSAPDSKYFNRGNVDATMEKIHKMKLEIPCFTTGCILYEDESREAMLEEAKRYIDLAVKTGVPYLRLMGDKTTYVEKERNEDVIIENLFDLSDYARGKPVTLLIETNGIYASTERIMNLMAKVRNSGRENVAILWDIHHTYRHAGETVRESYDRIGKYVRFCHIKDSVEQDGKIYYKMTGYGDVPVKEALELLKAGGYDGFVSLEWVKRWDMELEEPGIVFAGFISYVKRA